MLHGFTEAFRNIRAVVSILCVAVSRHWRTLSRRGGALFVGYCASFLVLFCGSLTDAPVESYGHFFVGPKKVDASLYKY